MVLCRFARKAADRRYGENARRQQSNNAHGRTLLAAGGCGRRRGGPSRTPRAGIPQKM